MIIYLQWSTKRLIKPHDGVSEKGLTDQCVVPEREQAHVLNEKLHTHALQRIQSATKTSSARQTQHITCLEPVLRSDAQLKTAACYEVGEVIKLRTEGNASAHGKWRCHT